MDKFESINTIEIYEVNGTETTGLSSDRPKLKIREHWNRKDFVVLELDGKKITLLAHELNRAVSNAQNAHRL